MEARIIAQKANHDSRQVQPDQREWSTEAMEFHGSERTLQAVPTCRLLERLSRVPGLKKSAVRSQEFALPRTSIRQKAGIHRPLLANAPGASAGLPRDSSIGNHSACSFDEPQGAGHRSQSKYLT